MSRFSRCCAVFILCALAPRILAQTNDAALKPIKVDGKDAGADSNSGVLAGKTLYVAGQDGRSADGTVPKDIQQETTRSLASVRGVLRAAGMDFGNTVSINIYITHLADVDAVNQAYWKAIGSSPPARTVLVVAALPNEENIQINCIAVKTAHRQAIHPQGWPEGAQIDPAGIMADDVLYISGQSGADPVTGMVPADFSAEVKQSLDNVVTILKTANMTMGNVVWVNPYVATGSQERAMNRVYATYFQPGNLPGRGTFTVVALPKQSHIIFSCIAGANLTKRTIVMPRNERPSSTSSPGNLYGDTLYLSAKDAYVPGLGLISPDLDIQARLSMRNLLDGLQEADMDFSNVASATIYMRDIKDSDQEHGIYGNFFKGLFPALTTLQQNIDATASSGEQISFIAVRQPKQ
jgi:enamine deaminase RidA (YjgF/YER057c/UK114 family)